MIFENVSAAPEGYALEVAHPHLISHENSYHSRKNSSQKPAIVEVLRTLALIKPDAFGAGKKDEIMSIIRSNGFTVVAERQDQWTIEKAREFYKEHTGKPFFDELTSWMSSAPIYTIVLEKQDGIVAWRALAGPTNSEKARETAPTRYFII